MVSLALGWIMSYRLATTLSVSPIIGKFTGVPWVSPMSLSHFRWLSTESTERPMTFTLRLSNSGLILAT
ncbi:unannotated protein [freshwater metagenome]|uniref:Unannotated protein n=1 Tax=freshwater metagenome TaxID=449393 RepID=A0A6J7EK77_9ZZZZ